MSQPPDKGNAVNPFDPLGFWRATQDSTLDAWSKAMIELVNSEPYAEATARLLDSYLSLSIPMRKLLAQTMEQTLSQLNMPNRTEVISLAERLTNIEMRLDDMDARMDDILRLLKASAQASAAASQPKSEPEPEAKPATRPTRRAAASASGATAEVATEAAGATRRTTRRTRRTTAGGAPSRA